jgi:hypothetical protein
MDCYFSDGEFHESQVYFHHLADEGLQEYYEDYGYPSAFYAPKVRKGRGTVRQTLSASHDG